LNCRSSRALVFVEVKARDRADAAAEAVTERTKRRIVATAELWLAHHPDDNEPDIRFDVMLVRPAGCRNTSPTLSMRAAEDS